MGQREQRRAIRVGPPVSPRTRPTIPATLSSTHCAMSHPAARTISVDNPRKQQLNPDSANTIFATHGFAGFVHLAPKIVAGETDVLAS